MQRIAIILLAGFLGLVALAPFSAAEEHVVQVVNNEFKPATLNVAVGDTVRFEWSDNSDDHNVAQVDSNDDDTHDSGFRSGDKTDGPHTWTLPASYTNSDTNLYYICEPHVGIGMRGQIVVGNGDGSGDGDEDSPGFGMASVLAASLVALMVARVRRAKA